MTRRMASFSGPAVAALVILAGARPSPAQQVVKLGEGETLTISGFINASLFTNHGLFGGFGQGQNAEWAAAAQPTTDKLLTDGDVRNTRINFTFNAAPVLGKWAPRATLEADFFGAFNGAPPFGDEQAQFRIRHAYVDLTNGRTTLRIGQFWAPLFNTDIPVSLVHIAFPVGLGSGGVIGWRFPGVFLYHDLTPTQPFKIQLQVAALKGSGPPASARDTLNVIGNGEASGLPQLEARLNVGNRSRDLAWSVYVVGHIDWKDTSGNGVGGPNTTGSGVELGGSVAPGHLTVHGNFYTGKGLGQQFGHISPSVAPAPTVLQQARIQGLGAWAQAGYDFTPHWSVWVFYGLDQPDNAKFFADFAPAVLPRQLNHDGDFLLRYRAGRYAIGLEYFRAVTRWNTGIRSADQYALSMLYTL